MEAWQVRSGVLTPTTEAPPAESHDALVDVTQVGICGSDWPKLRNPQSFQLPDPWQPGHEIVGTDPSGTQVAVDPLVPCQTCVRCHEGDVHLCRSLRRLGWELPGGFADSIHVPADNLHPLPNGLSAELAVLADPTAVALHGIRCHAIPAGEIAVIGAGPIGLLTALYARSQGWRVTVIHRDGQRPTVQSDALDASFRPEPDAATGSFDAVIDAASGASAAPLNLALRVVRDGGTIIVQNAYHPDVHLESPVRDIFRRSIRLIGSFSYCRRHQPDDFTAAVNLLSEHPAAAALLHRAGQLSDLPKVVAQPRPLSARAVLTVQPG